MHYVVSLGLLVAVLSWLMAVYRRLHELRVQAEEAWQEWVRATHRRNEQISSFANVFSGFLPQGAQLPRDLRRLAEDSERLLQRSPGLPAAQQAPLCHGEAELRHLISGSMLTMESHESMCDNDQLIELCGQLCSTLHRQELFAGSYNSCVILYNGALETPSARFVASVFGFEKARRLPESNSSNLE